MAVRIRLKKLGRRHRPFYRVSVMDARAPRGGRSIEDIGHYDPMVRDKSARISLKLDRIDYWLSVGAQPSEKVAALIKKVRTNRFSEAKEAPPITPPKEPPAPEPVEEIDSETSAEEAADENSTAEESTAKSGDDDES